MFKNVLFARLAWLATMQKRVKITCLRLLSEEWSVSKVGPCLASGNLGFGRVPTSPRTAKGDSLCLSGLCSVVPAELCFPSGGSFDI